MVEWQSLTVSYLDSGTLYLTEEQIKADRLIIEVNVKSYSNPFSESYKRNPPQSVYGYVTGVKREAVVFEKEIRFDYERFYDDFNIEFWLGRLLCTYFSLIQKNLRELSTAIQPPLAYLQTAIGGINPVLERQLDSVRFKLLNPGQFEFRVYWFPSVAEDPCKGETDELPEAPPPSGQPQGPQSGSSSPGARPAINGGQPVGPLTPVSPDALDGDFGPRNSSGPPIAFYQRGRVSSGYFGNCQIANRVAAYPVPAGQFPPFFAGATASTPNIPAVDFVTTGPPDLCGGLPGNFVQGGAIIEGNAEGIISWSYPIFARYEDGSWEVVG